MQPVEKSMDCFVGRIRPSHCSEHGLRRRPCGCRPPDAAECGPGPAPGCCTGDSRPAINQFRLRQMSQKTFGGHLCGRQKTQDGDRLPGLSQWAPSRNPENHPALQSMSRRKAALQAGCLQQLPLKSPHAAQYKIREKRYRRLRLLPCRSDSQATRQQKQTYGALLQRVPRYPRQNSRLHPVS